MLVSTNSAFMEFLTRPAYFAFRAAIWSRADAFEESSLSGRISAFLLHELLYGLGHKLSHGLVALGCIDSKSLQQAFRKTQGYVLMTGHTYKCITYLCEQFVKNQNVKPIYAPSRSKVCSSSFPPKCFCKAFLKIRL